MPPLLPERARRIDPKQGTFFQRGTAEFCIAWRGRQPVGTICAADDRAVNAQPGVHDCMFGFFECIPDYNVACALFERAAAWGRDHSLETLYGPFNLDYEDSYGILVAPEHAAVLLDGRVLDRLTNWPLDAWLAHQQCSLSYCDFYVETE